MLPGMAAFRAWFVRAVSTRYTTQMRASMMEREDRDVIDGTTVVIRRKDNDGRNMPMTSRVFTIKSGLLWFN